VSLENAIALLIFAHVAAITPGPNNIMLLASGTNFGFKKTIPHILGVFSGFMANLLLVTMGLGQLLQAAPKLYLILKIASALYLLYLAWKIANAASSAIDANTRAPGKPLTFLQAALFQWVNPKAWAAGLAAASIYLPPEIPVAALIIFLLTFCSSTIISTCIWTILGAQLQKILSNQRQMILFNRVSALLLIACLYPILFQNF